MKKLIIIILFLLIGISAEAQIKFYANQTYVGRATEFFKRCQTAGITLTENQRRWYNDSLFRPLIDSGLIGTTRAGDSIACLYSFGLNHAQSETIALMNLLTDQYNCTKYGNISFNDSCFIQENNTYLNTHFDFTDSSILHSFNWGFGTYNLNPDSIYNCYFIGNTNSVNFNGLLIYDYRAFYARINRVQALITFDANRRKIFSGYRYNNYQIRQNINLQINNIYEGISYLIYQPITIGGLTISGFTAFANTTFAWISTGLSERKIKALNNILNNSQKGYGRNVF